jgi:HK97 family phage major capsid protein
VATPDPALINTGDFFYDQTTVTVDLSDSRKFSWVQQAGTQVQFGLAGGRYLNIEDIQGGFVAAESGKKPVANPVTVKGDIAVREWAVVVPVSLRLFRSNPDGAIAKIQQKIPEAFARAFDDLAATGGGIGGQSALNTAVTKTVDLGTTTKANGGVWGDFNEGLRLLVTDGKELSGTVLDTLVEPVVNGATDLQGHPLFIDTPVGPDTNAVLRQGRLLGRPSRFVKNIRTGSGATKVVGYMGDWSRLLWGTVGGIDYFVSREGTYTDNDGTVHSAVQENLILFRAEALLGVQVADPAAFVKVRAGTTSAAS